MTGCLLPRSFAGRRAFGGSGQEPEPPMGLELELYDILGLVSLGPFGNVELYVIAFIQ